MLFQTALDTSSNVVMGYAGTHFTGATDILTVQMEVTKNQAALVVSTW